MTQETFKSYRETKGPEETNKWVEEQRALGNPKILSKAEWYEKNRVRLLEERIVKLEAKRVQQSFVTSIKQSLINNNNN
jgi:hypothetical protein